MSDQFDNKVIWVTGASGALGRAAALLLANRGATVVASGRTIASTDLGTADNIDRLPVDVTDDAAVRAAFASLLSRHKRIDGLVTSTNVGAFADFLDLTDEDWLRVIQTKLLGSVRPVRAVLPSLIKQQGGAIVLISGRGGIDPPPGHFPGASVNAALDLLVQSLGRRFGPDGVRINAVAPGPIQSPRLNRLTESEARKRFNTTATPGPGLPVDVAEAVAFLLSDAAKFVNGSRLYVDGGGQPYA